MTSWNLPNTDPPSPELVCLTGAFEEAQFDPRKERTLEDVAFVTLIFSLRFPSTYLSCLHGYSANLC